MSGNEALSGQDLAKNLQYGYIAFDDGQAGPAWMSVSGGEPQRIRGANELSTYILLLSNLSFEQMRDSGLLANPWVRGADYLKLTSKAILDEVGMTDEPDQIPEATKAISQIFHRIMMMVPEAGLKYRDAAGDSLPKELEAIWPEPELPINNYATHQDATRHCLQERTMCNTGFVKSGVMVTFRIPRIQHARSLLTSGIPVGPWSPLRSQAAPPGVDFGEWLLSRGKPFIAKVELPTGLADDAAPIVSFGSGSRDDGGNGLRRQWASDIEIRELMKYGKVVVKTALVARDIAQLELPPFVSGLMKNGSALVSNSVGIFLENLWLSLVLRRKKQATGQGAKQLDRFIISYRAAYLRLLDRVICMQYALKLSTKWTVKSYGVGSIMVSVDESEINDLVADAFQLGLEPTVGAAIRHNMSLPVDVRWGGPPPFEAIARMKANGKDAVVRRMDSLFFSTGDELKKALADIERLAA